MTQPTRSQWNSLLCNLGDWRGSFTRLSPQGVLKEDIPTQVTLEGLNQNQTVRQVVRHFSAETGEVVQEKVLEYSSLSRSTLFFEEGAFSQGSIQFAPFSQFGAELGFIQGDRRLRLVQLFDTHSNLSSLTLIREHRAGTDAAERPALTVEQLVGEWVGEAITLYADWRSPDHYTTRLLVQKQGDRLHQKLTAPNLELASTAQIQQNLLLFQETHPTQVLLLSDGASSNTPLTVPRGKPFFLEAGWLVQSDLRQRLIRSYDLQGGWVSLTLVTEHKNVS
ncbi:MAG: DUF3598 family protein [Leptolyngbyaceae cyanobacterium SL_5_9]|nr:DUF3598 family protein [Leptolyngbyaceae cyanobacterium SL_5_9]NJO72881.1 DUF3598 family protein [Leptolyngbyaceae cyanobacterium RM1_406_9]